MPARGNANGRWDTGILDSIQPEEVYYFPKPLKLKKNWDVAQDWNINELPLDAQKPEAIKKNKPKLRPGERRERTDEDDEDEDEFGSSDFLNSIGGNGCMLSRMPVSQRPLALRSRNRRA